jgi:hypothetical protein
MRKTAMNPDSVMKFGGKVSDRETLEAYPPLSQTVSQSAQLLDVMLSKAKHLAFAGYYEDEILRLRLRMTLRHSLVRGEESGRGNPG